MSSVASKTASDNMATSSTFSYAQAAKGQATTSQSTTNATTSPAPTSTTSPRVRATASSVQGDALPNLSSSLADLEVSDTTRDSRVRSESLTEKKDKDAVALVEEKEKVASSAASIDVSASSQRDEDTFGSDSRAESEDRESKSSLNASRVLDDVDPKKQRKGKKGKGGDRDAERDSQAEKQKEKERELLRAELLDAPPPPVNFWQQRIEAAAKVKPTPAVPVNSSPAVDANVGKTAEDTNSKLHDSKKKPKVTNETEAEDGPSGVVAKPQRRSTESTRPTSEQFTKGRPSRGSRVGEKEEKPAGVMVEAPPPVEDASLWPTPETAAEKKAQDKAKADKEDKEEPKTEATASKKKTWVPVPYVPSVTFKTQISRNPRGRGGGRGGRDAGNSRPGPNADKTSPTGTTHPTKPGTTTETRERPRDAASSTRAASLPPSASKRTSMDSTHMRDQRKPSAPAPAEKPKEVAADMQQLHFQPRQPVAEHRNDNGVRGSDLSKESSPPAPKDQLPQNRDRAEGRAERGGRGGYRGGRGAHNGTNGHVHLQSGTYPPPMMTGYPMQPNAVIRQQGPYSPPIPQNPFAAPFMPPPPPPQRNGRGGSRAGSTGYGRGNANGIPMNAKIAGIHTGMPAMVDYHMTPMTPYQYQTAVAPVYYDGSMMQVITSQLDYYFSVDNLCKDLYLRAKMDSQGYVPLTLIAAFPRMQQLGADLDALRYALERSNAIEFVVGVDDGIERLRRRDNWQEFVLSMEQRDQNARNLGPRSVYRPQPISQQYPTPRMMTSAYPMTSPTFMTPSRSDQFRPYMNGDYQDNSSFQSQMPTEMNGHSFPSETPLSAAVPEFSPSPTGPESTGAVLNAATTFTDEQVEKLTIVVESGRRRNESSQQQPVPTGSYSGNMALPTAPGGSAAAGPSEPNGVRHGTEGSNTEGLESENGNAVGSGGVASGSSAGWAQSQQAGDAKRERSYLEVRERAMRLRSSAGFGEPTREIENLYNFWSHFLIDHFNAKMYEEFRLCALQDAWKEAPALLGLSNLLKFYKFIIPNHRGALRDVFLRHFDEAKTLALSRGIPHESLELQGL